MRRTHLDAKWNELMTLSRNESEFRRRGNHPKLVKFLGSQIERLAREMGFGPNQIQQREFRAVKEGDCVIRLLTR